MATCNNFQLKLENNAHKLALKQGRVIGKELRRELRGTPRVLLGNMETVGRFEMSWKKSISFY